MEELSIDTKTYSGLKLPTDPRWVDLTAPATGGNTNRPCLLRTKAATTCISLIITLFRPGETGEGTQPDRYRRGGYFRQVLAELQKRQLKLGKQRKDVYVNKLSNSSARRGHPDERFLDQLLTMAPIEARSCERFKRLS